MSHTEIRAPGFETGREFMVGRIMRSLLPMAAFVAIGCAVFFTCDVALACSPPTSGVRGPTVLGLDSRDTSLSVLIPLNPVFVQSYELRRESGEAVEMVPIEFGLLGRRGFSRAAEPLLPNTVYELGSMRFMTGDFVDEVPPTTPTILDAEWVDYDPGECGPFDELNLEIEAATDDTALSDNLSYAIYFGASEEDAWSATAPVEIVAASRLQVILLGADPYFVAIEAIDPAGNVGPRSSVSSPRLVQVGGCAVVGPGTGTSSAPIAYIALGLLVLVLAKARFVLPRS